VDRAAKKLFLVVPKTDSQEKRELLVKQITGEFPADEKALALWRIFLARIGRADVGRGEEIPIDPLLLYVEVVFVTSLQKGEDKNHPSEYPHRHGAT
jgi:hypothetical protein